MVMKDKLYKNHHKGIYYKTRKALIVSGIFLSLFGAISIPTYINYKNSKSPAAEKREEIKVIKPEEVEFTPERITLDVAKCPTTGNTQVTSIEWTTIK